MLVLADYNSRFIVGSALYRSTHDLLAHHHHHHPACPASGVLLIPIVDAQELCLTSTRSNGNRPAPGMVANTDAA
jgi:hypothetical protein